MYRKSKAINRNLVYPVLNAIHTNNNDITPSIQIIEVNSEGEEINTEHRNNIDRPLFDTHNDLLMDAYERNRIEREAIIDADKYFDYFGDERSKYDSNLRDIFTDIYSDMHCDISSIPSTSNTDDVKYYKSMKNFVSDSSSEDSLSFNIFEPKSRKKWCKYNTILENNSQIIETDCAYEYYFKNENNSPLTSPNTDEDEDIVSNKLRINRISSPIPSGVPKVSVQTRPSLPTVLEIAESNLTDNNATPAKEKKIKNENSWLKENKHITDQPYTPYRERYFSWIPLWINDNKHLSKIKKYKSISQLPEHASYIIHLGKDSPKTTREDEMKNKEIDVENTAMKSIKDTNKKFVIDIEDIEIKSTKSSKASNEESERIDKLQLNILKELEQINAQVNGSDSEESNSHDKQNILESESLFSNDVRENSANDSCGNKNISIDSVVRSNTIPATSVPSLHLSIISNDRTRTWFQKVSKCFCCQWRSQEG